MCLWWHLEQPVPPMAGAAQCLRSLHICPKSMRRRIVGCGKLLCTDNSARHHDRFAHRQQRWDDCLEITYYVQTDVTDWRVRTTKDTANRQFSKAWSGEWRKRSFPSSILDRRELQVAETRDHRGCWCGLGGGSENRRYSASGRDNQGHHRASEPDWPAPFQILRVPCPKLPSAAWHFRWEQIRCFETAF